MIISKVINFSNLAKATVKYMNYYESYKVVKHYYFITFIIIIYIYSSNSNGFTW